MNSKNQSRLFVALGAAMLLTSQWQGYYRLARLEQQLAQLRLDLAQRPASPQPPQVLAQQPVAPQTQQTTPETVASLAAATPQEVHAQTAQERRIEEPVVHVPASLGALELTT